MENPEKQLKDIELTQTQRERAETLYSNLCQALQERGLNIKFYPQGSFALRTAVRPYHDGKEQAYDVDVICEFEDYYKDSTECGTLMHLIKHAVKEICKERNLKMFSYERCVTVVYADDPSGVSFSIDLIPAVRESQSKLTVLRAETEEVDLVETSIAIDSINKGWITNNPQGYRQWFDESARQVDERYVQESRGVFASVEDLPDDTPSSRLRQSIKLLKRLRDVYYDEINANTSSPSVIITTIATKLVIGIPVQTNGMQLLQSIIQELNQVFLLNQRGDAYISTYEMRPIAKIVTRKDGKWILNNPTNGEDNVLSSWNQDGSLAATEFFEWIKYLQDLVIDYTQRGQSEIEFENQFTASLLLPHTRSSTPSFHVNKSNGVKPWKLR